MKDHQKNFEDKLRELPTHNMSKSTQDDMHQNIMNALNDVETQQKKGSKMLMKKVQVGIASAAAIVLIGILGSSFFINNENQTGEPEIEQTPAINGNEQQDKESTIEEQTTVEQKAPEIYNALRNRDMEVLSTYVHSEKGLFLSLLDYFDQFGEVFEKNEVRSLLEDDTEYFWGYGEANMELAYTPKDYMDRYLKADTFLNPNNAMFDSQTERSDFTERLKTAFPGSKIVEFYKEPEYEDWKSVYLVFEPNAHSIWELSAIISSEWTP